MRMSVIVAFMLLSGAILAPGASAQETFVDRVKACSAMMDDAARLKCFDAAVQPLRVEVDPSDTRMTVPKAPAAAETRSIVPTETPDRISVRVTAIEAGADGKLRFTLSNGETWRQTDSTALKNLGKGPWEAELRKAAMGSFMLRVGNKAAVRVTMVK
jgi:hypothetical protein